MPTLGWRILLLVVAARALPDPSGAHNRHRRQIDTSHLSDSILLCQLSSSEKGESSNDCNKNQPPTRNPDAETIPGSCSCAPAFQCTDNKDSTQSGGFLTQVNVRLGSSCPKPEEVCCNNIDTTKQPLTLPFTPSCGKRNTQGIVNNFVGFQGGQSQFGEFPWMAAVMTSEKFGDQGIPLYICGASLIHSQVVLTTAHHVQDKSPAELTIRLGEWNFKEMSEFVPHQEYGVKELQIHPNYVRSTLAYDVALLILEQPAKLGHTIDTICLPPANYDYRGHTCVVSGWGKDVFSELGRFQQILKSIELPPVDHSTCQTAMRGTRLGSNFNLHESFMCAGGEAGQDACEGDGGSPLVCHKASDPSKYFQAGVVSWGIGCGEAGVPGVYADVSKAVPWINSLISSRFGHDVRSVFSPDLRSGFN